ncbi:MAG: hypothetical protein ACI4KL_07020 [Lentihominibacter sp.]
MNQENNNYEPTPGFRPVAPDPAGTDNSKALSIAAAVGFFVTAAISLYLAVTSFMGFIEALEYGGGFYASASLLWVPIYLIVAAGCVITGLYIIMEMNKIIGAIGPAAIAVGCLLSIILEGYIVVIYQSPAYLGIMAGFLLYAAAAVLLAICIFTGNRKLLGAGRYIIMALALLAFIVLLVRYITFWTGYYSFGYYGGASYFSMYGGKTLGDIGLSLGFILTAQLLSQKPERYLPKAAPSSAAAYMYVQQPAPEHSTRYVPDPVYGIIANARVFGILSIVGAFIVSIAGLILGIVGMNKVKNLAVPPEMEYERQKAYNLNKIGFILSIVFIGLSILLAILAGCISAATAVYSF